MIADSQTAEALLAYICQHPGEDAVRLAYADLLEDRGEGERAEFIRIQCKLAVFCPTAAEWALPATGLHYEYLRRRERELGEHHGGKWLHREGVWVPLADMFYRRGFVAEVTLTTEAFVGGSCGRCAYGAVPTDRDDNDCPHCHGTGRTPGHAAALCRAAPIERVTLSDREPWNPGTGNNRWWFCLNHGDPEPPPPWTLPDELFALLEGYHPLPSGLNHRRYDDDQHAHDALAAATLLLGRRQGWPCPRCGGKGRVSKPAGAGWLAAYRDASCADCHGTGHTVEGG